MELYKAFRPKTLKGVIGQDDAIASLQKLLDKDSFPRALLITGPSGTGKTTIARILKDVLKCGDSDYREVDCATVESPLDTVREIQRNSKLSPMSGPCRIYFLEEAQSLSRAGFSQQAMLKMLEDVPKHVYFFLASTDPSKLHDAILTRCTEVKLKALKEEAIRRVIQRVIDKEGLKVRENVIDEVVEVAEGSARKALVILEQVAYLDTEEDQLKAIQVSSFNKDDAFKLAQLVFNFRRDSQWVDIAKVLRGLKEQDVEGIRYCMLGYARSVLIGKEGKPPNARFAAKAFDIIGIFGRNFYDSKHAGLAAACYEAFAMLK